VSITAIGVNSVAKDQTVAKAGFLAHSSNAKRLSLTTLKLGIRARPR